MRSPNYKNDEYLTEVGYFVAFTVLKEQRDLKYRDKSSGMTGFGVVYSSEEGAML